MSYLENIKTFVRVYELGSMSAAGRDLRISPAVTSARISQLEDHLSVRLFQRTTRSLTPTAQGKAFYGGACSVLDAVDYAEAQVMDLTENPKGQLFVAAPLGVGRRLIAPAIPDFAQAYPLIDVRLRLTDRKVDMTAEGLDMAFHLGQAADSALRIKKISDVPRALVAAPDYIRRRGHPVDGTALIHDKHDCLNLRFPGATEFQWHLMTEDGPQRFRVTGRLESDDGDVLLDWALAGQGVALKPLFEVAAHLRSGALVAVCVATPPVPVQMSCLYTHRRHQDPKTRLFMDFIVDRLATAIRTA